MKESLVDTREETLAKESFVTAKTLSQVRRWIDLPQDVSGLTILDVGAGASTATKELRLLGASAYALDYAYRDNEELEKLINLGLDRAYAADVDKKQKINQGLHLLSNRKPSRVGGSYWDFYLKNTSVFMKQQIEVENIQYQQYQKETSAVFFSDFLWDKTQPYVAALAGKLPFKENTFDIVYSLQCITSLMKNRDVFMQVIEEQLHILKPSEPGQAMGGQLQLHPWLSDKFGWTPQERNNGKRLLTHLKDKKIRYAIEKIPNNPQYSPRLKIFKP